MAAHSDVARRQILRPAAYFVVLSLTVAISVYAIRFHAAEVFSSALRKAASAQTVSIAGTKYTVRGGVVSPAPGYRYYDVMRLAYGKTLAERSPLIGLPGVDLEKLSTAIHLLSTTSAELADIQKDNASAQDVRTSLYPTNFLTSALQTEQRRRAFINSATADAMEEYEDSQSKTIGAYLHDLKNFKHAFLNTVPPNENKFVVADKFVSRSVILAALERMRAGIEKTNRRRIARTLCLLGLTPLCTTEDLTFQLPPVKESPTTIATGRTQTVRSITADIFDQPEILKSPIIVTDESRCVRTADSPPAFFIYSEKLPPEYPPSERVSTASDMRFLLTEKLKEIPLYKRLSDEGITYAMASPLTHYACLELGYDVAKAISVRNVRTFATKNSLSHYDSNSPETIGALERKLSGDTVFEKDALAYLSRAIALTSNPAFPSETKQSLESLILEISNHSAGLNDTLTLLAKTESYDSTAHTDGIPVDLSAQNLFFARSGMQLTFMTNNPSVAGSDVFNLQDSTVPDKRQPYVFLSELPATNLTQAKIIGDSRLFIKLLTQAPAH